MPLIQTRAAASAQGFGFTKIAAAVDKLFNYVSLLLTGNGTNGAQNNTFLDSSSNNFTVTRNGNTTQGSFSPFGDTWSNYFDGTGDYLSVPDNAAWNFGTGAFTIEAWIYPQGAAAFQRIYSQYSTEQNQIFFRRTNTNALSFFVISSGSTLVSVTTTNTLSANTWNHVAIVRNGNVFTIYVNGTSDGSSTASITVPDLAANLLISTYDGTNEAFNGYISNLRVVKGTAVYTANFIPPTSPLTAITNTSLLTCQSNRFIDNSTNNFAITVNGNTSVQKFSPFLPNGNAFSNYFDGTGDYLTVPDNPALDFGGDNFTVECWVSLNSSPGGTIVYGVVGKAANSSVYQGFEIYFYQSTAPRVAVTHNGTSWGVLGESSISLSINKWAHIALTRNGNTYTLWVDGQSGFSTTLSGSIPDNSAALSIGAIAANGDDVFPGYISNLRIVKGTAVYTTAFTPPTSPLTAISGTSLLTCQSSTIKDNSRNNFTLTVNGNTSVNRLSPFVAGSYFSGYFDGSGDSLTVASNAAFAYGTGDFTTEFWFYPTNTTWSIPFDSRNTSPANNNVAVQWSYTGSTSKILVYADDDFRITSTNTFPTNAWMHVAVVRSGTTLTLYVNGTNQGTYTYSTNVLASQLYIGQFFNGGYEVNGYIANLRMVKGTAVYTAAFTPPAVPVLPITNTSLLLNFANAGIQDVAMINDIETVGNAQVSTTQSKFGGGSLSFDGTGDYLSLLNNINLQLTNTTPFTIEMWVYPNVIQSIRVFLSAYKTTSPYEGYALRINSNGAFEFWDGTSWTSFGVTASATAWTHIAVSYEGSGTTRRLFVNGVQNVSAGTVPSTINYTAGSFIVGGDLAGNDPFNGYIDELRITKGIARYVSNFNPPPAPFKTY